MKKLLASILYVLLVVGVAPAQESCDGANTITVDIGGKFSLCWVKNPEPDVVKYMIYKGNQVFDEAPNSVCNDAICSSPVYTESVPGTYMLTVAAVDGAGQHSLKSDPVTLTVIDKPPSKPTGCVGKVF